MSSFHVDKLLLAVEVWTTDGDVSGKLHLSPFAKTHSGSETVLDLMSSSELFLPLTNDGRVDLISKGSIVAIWYREEPTAAAAEALVQHQAWVYLRGRKAFPVLLRDERPPHKGRVSDFLNDSSPFIVTLHQNSRVLLSKQHLVRVVPGANPAPAAATKKAKAQPKKKKR